MLLRVGDLLWKLFFSPYLDSSKLGRERPMINSKKKVFIFILILISITLSVVIGFRLRETAVKKEMEMKNIVKTIVSYHYFSKIMNDVSYKSYNDKLLLEVQLKDSFTELSTLEQFAYLDVYCESIRDYVNVSKLNSALTEKDIILTSDNLGDVYKYKSTCWNNDVKMKNYYGILYVNDEEVYCQEQYKDQISTHNDSLEEEFYNGYSDLEIMKYALLVFNLITYGGEMRTLESDNKQITDEIIERFGITQDDFRKIYIKYYYRFQ